VHDQEAGESRLRAAFHRVDQSGHGHRVIGAPLRRSLSTTTAGAPGSIVSHRAVTTRAVCRYAGCDLCERWQACMQLHREIVRVPAHLKIRWGRYRRVRFSGSHQPCRLCGGNDTVVVSRFDRWLNPLVNVMCRGCRLVFLDPMPTDEEINAYYKDQ
jgi:hypothetical protein